MKSKKILSLIFSLIMIISTIQVVSASESKTESDTAIDVEYVQDKEVAAKFACQHWEWLDGRTYSYANLDTHHKTHGLLCTRERVEYKHCGNCNKELDRKVISTSNPCF